MKKPNKRIICLFIITAILFLLVMPITATAKEPKVGDIIGYVRHSDIVAYIDGKPIKTYNIDGYVAVITADLVDYGFNVVWDGNKRTSTIWRTAYNPWETDEPQADYKPEKVPANLVGTIAMPVYYTDIKCIYDSFKELKSFNVGGKLAVYLKDLAAIYADTYIWNSQDRTSKLTLVKPWGAGWVNLYGKSDLPVEHKGEYYFTFKNQSSEDKVYFVISDYDGDYFVYDDYYDSLFRVGPNIFDLSSNTLMIYTKYSDLIASDGNYRPGLNFSGLSTKI